MDNKLFGNGIFYLFISILAIYISISSDYKLILLAFFITIVISMIMVKFVLYHPFVWFLPFYFMYSCSSAVLVWQGVRPYSDSLTFLLKASWFSMLPLLLIISLKIESYKFINSNKRRNLLFFKMVWLASLLLSLANLIAINSSGFTNKREMNLNSDQIFSVSVSFSILLLAFSIIVALTLINDKKFPYKFVLVNIVFIFFAFLINGERDMFLRFLLISLMLYYILYKRIKVIYLVTIGFLMVILVPVLHNLKNFWITRKTNDTLSGNLIIDIFSSEFTSASNNLRIIYEANLEYKKGETVVWDILRFFSSKYHSTTQWFNETFFPQVFATGGGRGFSFLGEGYLNFGILGMMIWMTLLALIIRFIYTCSKRNVITLLVYLVSMPTFIYILRADFSNLFSGIMKQVVLPLVILFSTYWFLMQLLPNKYKERLNYNSTKKEDENISVKF